MNEVQTEWKTLQFFGEEYIRLIQFSTITYQFDISILQLW